MRIALFGSTGGTGHQVLVQALEAGHSVKALARDPSKLAAHERLTVVQGDVLDPTAVNACVEGTEAVACVLGTRPGTKGEPVEARGTERVLAAMAGQGVRRLVVVSSMGVGDSREQIPWFFRIVMNLTLKRIFQAKEEQERLIMASDSDWTIVRPSGLTDGPRTDSYRHGLDKSVTGSRIARADVAHFVLEQLGDDAYLKQAPWVT
jgi:putative NADH-flavin reductase